MLLSGANLIAQPQTPTIRFLNGRWFNGKSFDERVVYSVNGVFAAAAPRRVDTTVDLHGSYVVPPFADAHNHNVEFYGTPRLKALISMYLRDGVFYDQNPDNLPRARDSLAGVVNVLGGIDAIFANGGLTGTDGHPTGLFRRNLAAGVFTPADGDGGLLWYIDSAADLDRKWPRILAQHPDFIKTYLLYSEEYAKRRNDTAYFNWKGLNPALLPAIVRRAHEAGLRVMTHIETAADFHNALTAGADEIGHIPGFRGDEHGKMADLARYIIADADAALAARNKTIVITTVAGTANAISRTGPDSLLRRRLDSLHTRNLRTLERHGVALAIGSDNYRTTSMPEAFYIDSLGIFSNARLIDLWSRATSQAIFPGRKIGVLAPGYEASFLVLPSDPLRDFSAAGRITLRVKQGRILTP